MSTVNKTQAGARAQDVPPLEDLRPLPEIAKLLGMTVQSAHRWRVHPTTPLACWRRGYFWCSTDAAARDFIRRRSMAPGEVDDVA